MREKNEEGMKEHRDMKLTGAKPKKARIDAFLRFLKSERFMIILLIAVALAVRLYKLSKETFWLDEAAWFRVAFQKSIPELLNLAKAWSHPPLYFLAYKGWTQLFGIDQTQLILLSLVSGVISILLIYLILKRLFKSKNLAFTGALLSSFSLFHIYYSREATDISFFTMILLFSVLTFLCLLQSRSRNKIKEIALHSISTAALFYTHNYAFFIVLAQNITVFLFWKKHRSLLKQWLISQMIIVLLIMPQIMLVFNSAEAYSSGFDRIQNSEAYLINLGTHLKDILEKNTAIIKYPATQLGQDDTFVKMISAAAGILFTIILAFGMISSLLRIKCQIKKGQGKNRRKICWPKAELIKENLFSSVFLILMVLTPVLATAAFPSVYREKCFVFTILIYNAFIAIGIWNLSRRKIVRAIIVGTIIILCLALILTHIRTDYFIGEHEDWKGVAEFVSLPEQKDELIVVDVKYTLIPFTYYHNRSRMGELFSGQYLPLDSQSERVITVNNLLLINYSTDCFVGRCYAFDFERLNRSLARIDRFWLITSPHSRFVYMRNELLDMINQDFYNSSTHEFGSVQATEFRRK
ncbi:MAG: glycosyltransferase family 39 protein [archaeon]